MIKSKENDKGITLIGLIVTVLVLIIIASIGITAGFETADSIESTTLFNELQMIQARVDVIYAQLQNGEKTQADVGGYAYEERKGVMDRTFDAINEEGILREDYTYYTKKQIETYLGIQNISQSVLINWRTRDVISVEGIEINGVRYHRYEGSYKPSYTEAEERDITITTSNEKNGDIKKVTVGVTTEDNTSVTNFTLKYKLEDEETYKVANGNYFETSTSGRYLIEVSGNGIKTEQKSISVYDFNKYQEVEYIESTGTQYLEIDYIASNRTNSKGVFQITDVSKAVMLFGSRVSSTARAYSLNWGAFQPYKYYNSYDTGVVTTTEIDANKHLFEKNGLKLYIDDILIDTHSAVPNFTTPHNMIVFGCNTNGTIELLALAKIYSLQFYDGETIAVDLVPCYRKIDNVIGMYDLTNDVFYTNEGTGVFTKGKDI